MPQPESQAIRVGLIGLGRLGQHHVERLKLRDDFVVETVWDRHHRLPGGAQASCRAASDWTDIIRSPEIDLVLVADFSGERAAVAATALVNGKGVALAGCLTESTNESRELVALARNSGRPLCVLQPGRWEPEFLTVRAAVNSGELGPLELVRQISWSPAWSSAGPRTERKTHPDDEPPATARLIDQALWLMPNQPVGVQCRNQVRKGKTVGERTGEFTLHIEFEGGGTALIEQLRSTSVPFQTGWLVSGQSGGYRDGRLFRRLVDGEVYDVPWADSRGTDESMYDRLAEVVHRPGTNLAHLDHELRLSALLEAVRRSEETGEVCRLSG